MSAVPMHAICLSYPRTYQKKPVPVPLDYTSKSERVSSCNGKASKALSINNVAAKVWIFQMAKRSILIMMRIKLTATMHKIVQIHGMTALLNGFNILVIYKGALYAVIDQTHCLR